MSSRARIPVILVAGFLGSGKSTLLNHLLRSSSGSRIGLIINDFGAVNIDALLVSSQVDGVVGLGNGCICCTVDDDSDDGFAAVIGRILESGENLDAVVIEASGLAEPRTLIRMVAGLTDPRVSYGGLVYVVDGAEFLDTRRRHRELDAHVRIADLVVVNKADLVADESDVLAVVAGLNPSAPTVSTSRGVVDPALLFDTSARGVDDSMPRQLSLADLLIDDRQHCDDHRHLHDDYQSVSYETAEPLDPRRLAGFLERPPTGTYRIKGWVRFDLPAHRGKVVVHAVGGRISVDLVGWRDRPASSSLVVIGVGLDEGEVRAALDAAVGTDVDDEFGILSITRYAVDDRDG